MNDYYNYQYYYNQMKNNMINDNKNNYELQQKKKQNITLNTNNEGLYNPYQGFIRGNLFQGLYDPYLSTEPYDIKPINKQAEMLTELDSLGFAMIDLNLYLDVYPNDQQMIELFNQYLHQKKEIKEKYEKEYGPLTINSSTLNQVPWAWGTNPWPWQ